MSIRFFCFIHCGFWILSEKQLMVDLWKKWYKKRVMKYLMKKAIRFVFTNYQTTLYDFVDKIKMVDR